MTPFSGNILGAHQKIDRVARRNFEQLLPSQAFPSTQQILHFEGYNGPDAIKRKSPAKDEPWHFFQPFDTNDTQLLAAIRIHYEALTVALVQDDMVAAAFQAAWLAHAMVDGLTPAHHYPYEEKLVELRGGRTLESRSSVREKVLFPGDTLREQAGNNWKFWGPKGLFTTHFAFEWGVATLIAPLRLITSLPNSSDIDTYEALTLETWFRKTAQEVARLELYDTFYKRGWTVPLGRQVRRQLAPTLVRAVSLAWRGAALEANRRKQAA